MLKILQKNCSKLKKYFSTNSSSLLVQCIKERTLVRLSGCDSFTYLQGLITNDMNHLQKGSLSMYAMFLNSKGRILYDSIIYKPDNNENTYFIECDSDVCLALKDHLMKYKVRRKLSIDCVQDEFDIWAIVSEHNYNFDYKNIQGLIKQNVPNLIVSTDPRLQCLGLRVLSHKNFNISKAVTKNIDIEIKEENFYKLLRYKLGIGEGTKELLYEKCIPMEANGDYLHGISFHKGCYIGQELTARTYHTGVIRKRYMPLIFSEEVKISENGIPIFTVPELKNPVGKLQGVENKNGVGLLRVEEALKANELKVSDAKCKTHRPFWWPNEAPKERMNTA